MTVTIRYAYGIDRVFVNLSEFEVNKLREWMKQHGNYPSTTVLEFFYGVNIVYLNRDLVADMEVSPSNELQR